MGTSKTRQTQTEREHRLGQLDCRPPNPPWVPLTLAKTGRAPLSFYYSDPHSTVPVREVTRFYDNKADPNIETRTYGLFSSCEPGMRTGVVREGMRYVFFCTRRAGPRVLTGYYRIGWYHKGPPIKGYRRSGTPPDDYALAASEVRFVNPGFPLGDLTGYLRGLRLDTPFRTFRYLDQERADLLLRLLEETPDATALYMEEIKRLEQTNIDKHGFRYHNWRRKEGFTWESAPPYLGFME